MDTYKNKTITPVGSEQAYAIDTRILAGTETDIQAALAQQRIRPDLFVRFAPLPSTFLPCESGARISSRLP